MKAFPFIIESEKVAEPGMDLRDYFAAKAMQGLLANPKLQEQILKSGGAKSGWIEESAYSFADAMMKAREL
jgi:hypothetical protein